MDKGGATLHIGENTPEQVAYRLLVDIANMESKNFSGGEHCAGRKWLLDTYAECVSTVRDPQSRKA